ncbi:MAG: hemolytic protein HlpA-like protein [Blastopirellula sp.]|nr:hemolytic protein HlpA-like protein [Blastopirellula sp.]
MWMETSTPVIFLTFNRPDLTQLVFNAIAMARPKRLYVVSDGARPHVAGEAERVAETRAIIDQVSWPCDVLTDFAESNLGCYQRITSGLRWAFQQAEEAIVLEDDCLPDPSFFTYCDRLLDQYRDESKVGNICGCNFQKGHSRTSSSYYFSKYFHCWGWATWRSTWEKFDANVRQPSLLTADDLVSPWDTAAEKKYWHSIFRDHFSGKNSSWDFLWLYTCWQHDLLSVTPDVNLVSNIGFRADATRTSCSTNPLANLPRLPMPEVLRHPAAITRMCEADAFDFEHNFGGPRGMRRWWSRVEKLRRMVGSRRRVA